MFEHLKVVWVWVFFKAQRIKMDYVPVSGGSGYWQRSSENLTFAPSISQAVGTVSTGLLKTLDPAVAVSLLAVTMEK